MLRSAAAIIKRREEPVPYKELLNYVYMDLLDRKVSFESVRQIENTLLKHAGEELAIIEEMDQTGYKTIRKWWLGEKTLEPEKARPLNFLRRITSMSRPKLPNVFHLLTKWQRQRKQSKYRPKKQTDED